MRACKVKLSPLNAISCDSLGAEGSNESGVEYSQIVQGGGGSGGGVGVKALSWLPALVQGKQSVYIAPVELSLTASSAVRRLIQVRQDIETKQNFLSTLIGRVFVDPIICFVFKCTRSELVAFSWGVKRSSRRDSMWVGWDTMLAVTVETINRCLFSEKIHGAVQAAASVCLLCANGQVCIYLGSVWLDCWTYVCYIVVHAYKDMGVQTHKQSEHTHRHVYK